MTRVQDREKARQLRSEGKSYSEIKETLGVGKGTLSVWLRDMPLTREQLRKLRDLSPIRIERFRQTMKAKRQKRLDAALIKAKKDIQRLSKRDIFISGIHLYWAEGTKSAQGRIEITNTDPAILLAFLNWLELIQVPRRQIVARLQLYTDMDSEKEIRYWSSVLKISPRQFVSPYLKQSSMSGLSRKTGHGHGTCSVRFDNMRLWEYITMALKRLREMQTRP